MTNLLFLSRGFSPRDPEGKIGQSAASFESVGVFLKLS
jgi:hypothetical protein